MGMSTKAYRVKDVARLARVTTRALHHYDRLRLLVPSARTEAGYRLYSAEDLQRLQQILIAKGLGLPLEAIRRMLDDPDYDRKTALIEQREQLRCQAQRAEAMIRAVDAALDALEKEMQMEAETLFEGFEPASHEDEVRRRWGHTTAYAEAGRRTKGYTKDQWQEINLESDTLLRRVAQMLEQGVMADAQQVMDAAEEHRMHIDRWFYPCDQRMHVGLSEMYVADERFAAYFEKLRPGLAAYLAAAIRANAKR